MRPAFGRCKWEDYETFLAVSGLDWTDDPATKQLLVRDGAEELTGYASTGASLAEMLRLHLGKLSQLVGGPLLVSALPAVARCARR